MQIEYTVKRGKAAGTILFPHKHMDGKFVASPDRFNESYHRFDTADEAYLASKSEWLGPQDVAHRGRGGEPDQARRVQSGLTLIRNASHWPN